MKKLILLFAIVAVFGSCKKCYDCTTTTTTSYSSADYKDPVLNLPENSSITSNPFEVCGDDLKNAEQEMKTTEFILPQTGTGGILVTVSERSYCVEQ